jgi:tRNA(His) 5'-end guanylyltransferase
MKAYRDGERQRLTKLPAVLKLQAVGGVVEYDTLYDQRQAEIMGKVTKRLVEKVNAIFAFTIGEEINLVLTPPFYYGGIVDKMLSTASSFATAVFMQELVLSRVPFTSVPLFEARVFQAIDYEVLNFILHRQGTGRSNAVLAVAREHFMHDDIVGVAQANLLEWFEKDGIEWESLPRHFREGTFFKRVWVRKPFENDAEERLPENHHARTKPGKRYQRRMVVPVQPVNLFDSIDRLFNPNLYFNLEDGQVVLDGNQ